MLIGRLSETIELNTLLSSPKGEMLAIIGRRRIGKTYLVKQVYASHMSFSVIGLQHGTTLEQLDNFSIKLNEYFGALAPLRKPKNWLEAFHILKECLIAQKSKSKKKKVLFFDEVPWLAEYSRAKFIEALAYFWNEWASEQNIVVVLCGSATSWMTKNIVVTKGGLHNRITRMIHLHPFTLHETDLFLKSKGIHYDIQQLCQIYMAFGGVPYYLEQLQAGRNSVEQIQHLCFSKNAAFKVEFDNLYQALFSGAERHLKVVRALQNKWMGLTRQELLNELKIKDGGNITGIINDLVVCDFVMEIKDFRDKKPYITYRLIDEFSIFYLSFIEGSGSVSANHWHNMAKHKSYQTWCGYAFENICFRHQNEILKAMKLEAIQTSISSFRHSGDNEQQGIQVDMLIDRADNIVNLIEIKYYNEPFIITKAIDQKLRSRMAIFRSVTKTRKTIFTSLISLYGSLQNTYSQSLLAHDLTLEDLMKP